MHVGFPARPTALTTAPPHAVMIFSKRKYRLAFLVHPASIIFLISSHYNRMASVAYGTCAGM